MGNITLQEAKRRVSSWSKDTFTTVAESIKYHFARYGAEVSAENIWEYLRKTESFGNNLRKSRKMNLDFGYVRYMKSGFYVIKNINGKILSFGAE